MPRKKRKINAEQGKLEYPYMELSVQHNEIRLLSLQPGEFGDEVHCTLHHVSLDGCTEYTALSYTWGDPTNRKPINVGGFTMNVTLNLYDALHHLRDRKDLRTFWIDALCINQNDVKEREAQVLRMRDIYSQAERVEVWLGKADGDDYAAMELVRQLGTIVPDPEEILSREWKVSYHELFVSQFEESTPELLRALNGLYQRPWWTRIWIVQEVSLASQPKAQVTCGTISVRWLDFLVAAYAIEECWIEINTTFWQKFSDEPFDGFQQGIRLSQFRPVRDVYQPFTLLELLHQHRDCAATDPRDFIYGILGMSGDGQEMGIVPDYKASIQKIYTDLFQKHVKATGSLDMICACRNSRNFDDLPSWVPDWSTDQTVPGICINQRYYGGDDFPGSPSSQVEKYSAAGTTCAEVEFWEDGLHFSASGFTISSIVATGVIDDGMKFKPVETFGRSDENGRSASESAIFDNWLNLILDSPQWSDIEKRYGSGPDVLDAFCRTLVADRNQALMRPQDASTDTSRESSPEPVEANPKSEGGLTVEAEVAEVAGDGEILANDNGDNEDVTSSDSEPTFITDEEEVMFSPSEILNMTEDSLRSCLEVSWGKRLAILDTGFIGIVPSASEKGDVICILKGCSLPLVVHKGDSDFYKFLGESYFHGAAEGELMDMGLGGFESFVFE